MGTSRWHPKQRDAYLTHMQSLIEEYGWAVQGVFPTTEFDVWFAYTVGLTSRGLPELLISGIPGEQVQPLLNRAAEMHCEKPFSIGDEVTGIAIDGVLMRVIDAPLAEIGMAVEMYPTMRPDAIQLVWPDTDGVYPGPNYDHKRFPQPLYGPAWW